MKKPVTETPELEFAREAARILDDKKAQDILILDVRQLSTVTDYYVMASGTSGPHVKALASEIQHVFKGRKIMPHRQGGSPDSGWVVIDYFNVVIHVLKPETREYYSLEDLWADAPRLPR